jgi:hypothetical protein
MRRSLQQARISTAPSMHHWVRGNAASASNTSHCHCCAQLPKLHFSSVSSSLSRLQMSTHPSDVAGCRCDDVIFRILAETNPKTSRAQNVCTSSCASIKREHDCSLLRQRALTLALLLHTSPPVRMTGTSRPTAQQTAGNSGTSVVFGVLRVGNIDDAGGGTTLSLIPLRAAQLYPPGVR